MPHLAILHPRHARALLAGEKAVESRLSRARTAPFGRVRVGDRVYLKPVAGAIVGLGVVARVEQHVALTPADVDRLRDRFEPLVRAGAEYWAAKRTCRYATLLTLRDVRAVPPLPASALEPWLVGGSPRSAWRRLDDAFDAWFDRRDASARAA